MTGGAQTHICPPCNSVVDLKPHPNATYFKQGRSYLLREGGRPAVHLGKPISIYFGATYEKNING
jgi:hypothetical protein